MISIVITAFNEPNTISKAINAFLEQNIKEKYELIVACPDKETKEIVENYSKKYPSVKHFHDPGKGKSFALNLLFKELKGRIWFFTDGDVYVSKNSVKEMLKILKNEKIGCVGGKVVSVNNRKCMMGYWSHLLAYGAHKARREAFDNGKFLECSAYLFAFRKGLIDEIPLDVAEDAIIPYMIWKKGYKIGYCKDAEVFVKNPDYFKDWLKQRTRTAGAHTKLKKYAPDFPKMKSFKNELIKGSIWAWTFPKNIKEFYWTLELFPARLYMWLSLFYKEKINQKMYNDGWERVESTK
ncbi:MAG: glycosyltransferase family 2 protein [Nanoarchaeota archaeon]|nr:glycosyltransferase family 2 protein [Nanoarchaeota archaeon]